MVGNVRVKHLEFRTEADKAAYLDGAARLDAAHLIGVRKLALRLLQAHPGAEDFARATHRFVRDSIRYQRDTNRFVPGGKGEQFADSDVILARGYDDCDGKARLVVALVLAAASMRPKLGLDARIRQVWRGGHWRHAQAEIRWPRSSELRGEHGERLALDGWVLSDPIVVGLELGLSPETRRDPATGKIPVR